MKEPTDFKTKEETQRQEKLNRNRKNIENYFDINITSSLGGTFDIIGKVDGQTREDYVEFLDEWGWNTNFSERIGSSWSMTAKSETEYIVTVVKVEPKDAN